MFCKTNVQFLFNGTFYRQIDGVAMGSCLGPLFANVFVGYMEKKLQTVISDRFLKYFRYVDDVFVLFDECTVDIQSVLQDFNCIHENLKFTLEMEADESLAFLDVCISRCSDGSVSTSVFRKCTWSGLYTHFHSFVPVQYKANLVRCLVNRVFRICTPDKLDQEVKKVYCVLESNGYPPSFVRKFGQLPKPPVPVQFGPEKKAVYLKLPFIGDNAAVHFRRAFRSAMHAFSCIQLRVVFSTRSVNVGSLKDKLPVLSSSNAIYQFSCTCGCQYVGRTRRCLRERVREHVPRWIFSEARCPPRSTRVPTSAITRHLQVCTADVADAHTRFKVLYRSQYYLRLRVLEALAIKYYKPQLCTQKDFILSLSLPW